MCVDTMIAQASKRIATMEDAVRALPRPDGLPRGMYLDGGAFADTLVPAGDDPEESEFYAAMEHEENARREWAADRAETVGYKGGAQ